MIWLELFLSYARIGAFSFGGGYCMIPLMEAEIVNHYQWLTMREFVDIIAVAEMTPGPVAVNMATFVGYRVAGIGGALAATIGVILIPALIVTVLATLLWRFRVVGAVQRAFVGIRAAVIALILAAAITVGKEAVVDLGSVVIAIGVWVGMVGTRIHPIVFLIMAGLAGWLVYG